MEGLDQSEENQQRNDIMVPGSSDVGGSDNDSYYDGGDKAKTLKLKMDRSF